MEEFLLLGPEHVNFLTLHIYILMQGNVFKYIKWEMALHIVLQAYKTDEIG